MDGLRSFIEMDNHSASDVGHLRKGSMPNKAQRQKFSGNNPEVLREGADDFKLRAEELDTLRAFINVDHTEENKWESAAGGSRFARFLPSNLQRN